MQAMIVTITAKVSLIEPHNIAKLAPISSKNHKIGLCKHSSGYVHLVDVSTINVT